MAIKLNNSDTYEKDYGLFAVEEGAVESGTIYSPYNGNLAEN